jgi:hypothetical protein
VIVDIVARIVLAFVLGWGLGYSGLGVSPGAAKVAFNLGTLLGYYVVLEYFFGVTIGKTATRPFVMPCLMPPACA